MRALALVVVAVVACGGKKDAAPPPPPPPTPTAPVPQPVAIAIVFNGQEAFTGNDDVEPETSASRRLGALKGLEAAIDRVELARGLPAGSVGTVITYSDKALVVVPASPIAQLAGATLGTQKTYYGKVGTNLVGGLELAQAELIKTGPATRKVMIVVGDGSDTNNEAAKTSLPKLKAALDAAKIEVHAVIYKTELSDPGNVISLVDADVRTIATVDNLAPALSSILAACCAAKPVAAAPQGGKPVGDIPLALAILFNGQEVYAGNAALEPATSPARHLGILADLETAVDQAKLATLVPDGSVGLVITYDDAASIRVPIGPVARISGAAFGSEKDYSRKFGTGLVAAIELAQAELVRTGAKKQVIVVVSDGNDTNNEAAKAALAKMKGLEVHALIWKGELSADEDVISVIDPKATKLAKASDLPAAFAKTLADCCHR